MWGKQLAPHGAVTEVAKMKFKIKKYLVVLLAVLMLASLAVIPTSAAYTGNTSIITQHDFWYVHYWTEVDVWCESDDPHWCWARVDDPDGDIYDYYFDSQMTAKAVAYARGLEFLKEIDAAQYVGSGDYGGQSK